jgi:hypothetical protein
MAEHSKSDPKVASMRFALIVAQNIAHIDEEGLYTLLPLYVTEQGNE